MDINALVLSFLTDTTAVHANEGIIVSVMAQLISRVNVLSVLQDLSTKINKLVLNAKHADLGSMFRQSGVLAYAHLIVKHVQWEPTQQLWLEQEHAAVSLGILGSIGSAHVMSVKRMDLIVLWIIQHLKMDIG